MTTRLFDHAQHRDPQHRRRWIVLLHGHTRQVITDLPTGPSARHGSTGVSALDANPTTPVWPARQMTSD